MSKRHNWHYSDAAHCGVGRMICTACQQKITHGEFRYRDTEAAYLPQHKSCSKDDPMWAKLDKDRADKARRWAEFRTACAEFKKRWAYFLDGELDDCIGDEA